MQPFAFKPDDSVGVTVEETPSLLGAYNKEVMYLFVLAMLNL
jgi:hypothetical protein